MANYTVTTTDTQQLALEYETERRNALQAQMLSPQGGPLPTQTPAELLQATVAQHLDMLAAQVRPAIEPLVALMDATAEQGREALINTVERPSLANFLRAHLTTGVMP
jgi:hypothetical protein